MANPHTIWNYEAKKVDKIARHLLEKNRVKVSWRILLLPLFLIDYIRFKKHLWVTRKNLLFTKQLAFNGARAIVEGSDRSTEIGAIEQKTKVILDRDKKGLYTEKVRRKQLHEIELLLDHYLGLLRSDRSDYFEMTAASYQNRGKYLSFIDTLQKAEMEVIQAAIATMRTGSKSDRRQWFKRVSDISRQTWMDEAKIIFTNTKRP
jgi:hypothetical protein